MVNMRKRRTLLSGERKMRGFLLGLIVGALATVGGLIYTDQLLLTGLQTPQLASTDGNMTPASDQKKTQSCPSVLGKEFSHATEVLIEGNETVTCYYAGGYEVPHGPVCTSTGNNWVDENDEGYMVARTCNGIPAGCTFTCTTPPPSLSPLEVSGVTVDHSRQDGNPIVVVGDEDPGVYFSCPDGKSESSDPAAPPYVKHFLLRDCKSVEIKDAKAATDFESIDKVGDGEYLILSESSRTLIVAHGKTTTPTNHILKGGPLKVQYHNTLSEVGGRGLEGLVVMRDSDNQLDPVVLWEGGYPEEKRLVPELQKTTLYQHAIQPILVGINAKLDPNSTTALDVRFGNWKLDSVEVPLPIAEAPLPSSADPNLKNYHRFRATDLVAYKNGNQDSFVILISTSSIPFIDPGPQFEYACLLEVYTSGKPTGRSLDIKDILRRQGLATLLEYGNWEGLAWYDKKRLVLVNDNDSRTPPTALVIEGPDGWKLGKECLAVPPGGAGGVVATPEPDPA